MRKLQDELNKRKWRNGHQLAMTNVLFTAQWLKEQFTQALEPYRITIQQYHVLRILRTMHPEGMSSTQIQQQLLDKTSDVSRLIARLYKLKLIKRRKSKEDGRITNLFLSYRGLELLGQIRAVDKIDKVMLPEHITEEEAQMLSALLDKMRG